ncbi:hypothetical protein THAOC_00455, partial [Thalassiosira oceanica]
SASAAMGGGGTFPGASPHGDDSKYYERPDDLPSIKEAVVDLPLVDFEKRAQDRAINIVSTWLFDAGLIDELLVNGGLGMNQRGGRSVPAAGGAGGMSSNSTVTSERTSEGQEIGPRGFLVGGAGAEHKMDKEVSKLRTMVSRDLSIINARLNDGVAASGLEVQELVNAVSATQDDIGRLRELTTYISDGTATDRDEFLLARYPHLRRAINARRNIGRCFRELEFFAFIPSTCERLRDELHGGEWTAEEWSTIRNVSMEHVELEVMLVEAENSMKGAHNFNDAVVDSFLDGHVQNVWELGEEIRMRIIAGMGDAFELSTTNPAGMVALVEAVEVYERAAESFERKRKMQKVAALMMKGVRPSATDAGGGGKLRFTNMRAAALEQLYQDFEMRGVDMFRGVHESVSRRRRRGGRRGEPAVHRDPPRRDRAGDRDRHREEPDEAVLRPPLAHRGAMELVRRPRLLEPHRAADRRARRAEPPGAHHHAAPGARGLGRVLQGDDRGDVPRGGEHEGHEEDVLRGTAGAVRQRQEERQHAERDGQPGVGEQHALGGAQAGAGGVPGQDEESDGRVARQGLRLGYRQEPVERGKADDVAVRGRLLLLERAAPDHPGAPLEEVRRAHPRRLHNPVPHALEAGPRPEQLPRGPRDLLRGVERLHTHVREVRGHDRRADGPVRVLRGHGGDDRRHVERAHGRVQQRRRVLGEERAHIRLRPHRGGDRRAPVRGAVGGGARGQRPRAVARPDARGLSRGPRAVHGQLHGGQERHVPDVGHDYLLRQVPPPAGRDAPEQQEAVLRRRQDGPRQDDGRHQGHAGLLRRPRSHDAVAEEEHREGLRDPDDDTRADEHRRRFLRERGGGLHTRPPEAGAGRRHHEAHRRRPLAPRPADGGAVRLGARRVHGGAARRDRPGGRRARAGGERPVVCEGPALGRDGGQAVRQE